MLTRALVVGAGAMGRNHARVLSELPTVELVGVVDTDLPVAEQVANQYHTQPYTSLNQFLEQQKPPDIAHVVVPTAYHTQVALPLIERGVHLLVEKPIATSVTEAEQIIQAAQKAKVCLTIGHIERFNPAILELKKRLNRGELGRIFQVDARRQGPFPARIKDAGVVIDLAVHDLDIIRYITGAEIDQVFAQTQRQIHSQHEDLLTGIVRLGNGAIGTLTVNWLTPTKVRELWVTGQRGLFRANYLTQDLEFFENAIITKKAWDPLQILQGVGEGRAIRYPIAKEEPLRLEIQAFLKAVHNHSPSPIPGSEGLKALTLAHCLITSADTNQVVRPLTSTTPTPLQGLQQKIQSKTALLGVVGLGYVGLPVACTFAKTGFDVIGVDIQAERVQSINQKQNPIKGKEPGLTELLQEVIATKRFRATTNYTNLENVDIVLIAVETPVDKNHQPQYHALREACRSLGPVLKKGGLVVVESTVAPGTLTDMVGPLLEKTSGGKVNYDFFLGTCPERVMPGKLLSNLRQMHRVCGGSSDEVAQTLVALYRHITQAELEPTDLTTAEIVKTAENAYRDVQIAFANELARTCEVLGANVWQVRKLVNKSPHRQVHLPGLGVGGHCIPKDPWLLAYAVKDKAPLRLIPAARQINENMPLHTAMLVAKALQQVRHSDQARVVILGYSYLEDSDDTRNSPSEHLRQALEQRGMEVAIHDPWVEQYQGDLMAKIEGCHAAILAVKHSQYKTVDWVVIKQSMVYPVVIDARGFLDPGYLQKLGFHYYGIGYGSKP